MCVSRTISRGKSPRSSVQNEAKHTVHTREAYRYSSTTPSTTGKLTQPTASSRHTRDTHARWVHKGLAFLVFLLGKRIRFCCHRNGRCGVLVLFVLQGITRHTRLEGERYHPAQKLSPGAKGHLVCLYIRSLLAGLRSSCQTQRGTVPIYSQRWKARAFRLIFLGVFWSSTLPAGGNSTSSTRGRVSHNDATRGANTPQQQQQQQQHARARCG